MTQTKDNDNPFPGLRPFHEEENYLFFGRESQIDDLINKLSNNKFLAVVGTSGSGKSSLVNCGLFPALHGGNMSVAGSNWRIAKFRPGNDPIWEMALKLAEKNILFKGEKQNTKSEIPLSSIIQTNLLRSKLGLIETYKQARLQSGENLLVVVDQFEELFRFKNLRRENNKEAENYLDNAYAFINLLLSAAHQTEVPIYIVITMRSDFLGDCSTLRGLPEAINQGQYLVPRMKRRERQKAIVGPIEVAGAKISNRLLMRLVNDVGDNPDQLSILQHALNRTWAEWKKTGDKELPIDLKHYNEIGTMAAALDKHADRAYHELNSTPAKNICKKMFKALTDMGTSRRGVRRPTRLKTLCAITEASEEEVIEVIDTFRKPSRSFLMPPIKHKLDQESIIDISHESFMRIWKKLIKWNEEEQDSMRTYRRLSDRAMLHKEGKSSLLDETYLRFALIWRKRQNPNAAWASRFDDNFEDALDYLSKSEKQSLIDKQKKKALQEAKQLAEIRKIKEEQQAKLNKQRAEIRRKEKQRNRLIILFAITTFLFSITGILLYHRITNKQLLIETKNFLLEDVEKIRGFITSANANINLIPDIEAEDLSLALKLANTAE